MMRNSSTGELFSHPIPGLNELEFIQGGKYLLANRFGVNYIYLFETATGQVKQRWDMSDLARQNAELVGDDPKYDWGNAVLNGIAYHEPSDTFVIAGKDWDLIFYVKLNILHN